MNEFINMFAHMHAVVSLVPLILRIDSAIYRVLSIYHRDLEMRYMASSLPFYIQSLECC